MHADAAVPSPSVLVCPACPSPACLLCLPAQAGKWQFLFFSGTFDVALNVLEAPQDRSIVFTLAESTFMRAFEGQWKVCRGTT